MCHSSNVAMSAFSTPETNERRQLTWVFICCFSFLRWRSLSSCAILCDVFEFLQIKMLHEDNEQGSYNIAGYGYSRRGALPICTCACALESGVA